MNVYPHLRWHPSSTTTTTIASSTSELSTSALWHFVLKFGPCRSKRRRIRWMSTLYPRLLWRRPHRRAPNFKTMCRRTGTIIPSLRIWYKIRIVNSHRWITCNVCWMLTRKKHWLRVGKRNIWVIMDDASILECYYVLILWGMACEAVFVQFGELDL